MHAGLKTLFAALAILGASAQAGDGLSVSDSVWQARLSIGTDDASPRLLAVSLLGDYYFTGLKFGSSSMTGGFRATSGVMMGAGSAMLGAAGVPVRLGNSLSLGHYAAAPAADQYDQGAESSTLPYLGVGYTSLAAAGGWGFTADIGIVAQNPGSTGGVPRALFGPQKLDDAVRDLRLMPVLQLGVRYSF